MFKKIIAVGDRFGHLEVIEPKQQTEKRESWLCRCDCGKKLVLGRCRLLGTKNRNPNKSCGCKEYTHDGLIMKNKKLYDVWFRMVERCHNENSNYYDYYGGKGISVCVEWRNNYETFYEWALGSGYKDGLTIDRIGVNKNYEPSNCRWTNWYVQAYNRNLFSSNKTGVTGVVKREHGYIASINRNGIRRHLGSFKTLEGAENARLKAEKHFKQHGTIANL